MQIPKIQMKNSQNKEKLDNKRSNNKWLVFINIPAQMALIIVLFSYLGTYLETNDGNSSEWYYKITVLVGVFIAIGNTIRQVIMINKK